MTVTPTFAHTPNAAPKGADQVPGPGGGPLASVRMLRSDPLAGLTRLRRTYGPVVRIASRPMSAFLVADPAAIADGLVGSNRTHAKGAVRRGLGSRETVIQPLTLLLGQGLLTSAGDVHRRQRRLMQPLFHHQRIAGYSETFAAVADATAGTWGHGQHLDVHAEMTEMTLAIVARTLFDVDLDSEVIEVVRTALTENMAAAGRARLPGFEMLERLPLPAARRRRDARAALDRVVYALIERRRAAGADGDDLLSLLLSTRDADTGVGMADEEVRDEALTILLAGHETTANALSWTFHLLGRDRTVAARMHAELDEVLGDRRPTMADIARLPYTDAVLRESMRLYPPVWTMGRHLTVDREVGGYLLPAGSTLLFSQWVVHRDETWWPDPERFDPTRWLVDATIGVGAAPPGQPRYSYFPFGGGPRQCIGNTFAHFEGVLALAAIARRWSFEPDPDVEIVPLPQVTLRPRDGLPMTAHRRR
ncbi:MULTISPECIES: cytochrome P450 [unclassified Frankia]|uniref:cytochrome P450 n=1 Tax=unclassified Frankia TaxID=2632575 RepID=UPI002AD45343|nr:MULTISPECIES: cytochrome P450 [unclassified Frankia]